MACRWTACGLALGALLLAVCGAWAENSVHILYLTDCRMYSDWQSVAMAFAFKNSGQQGHMTRVMCCTDEEKKNYNHDMLEIMESHVAPSFSVNAITGDDYAAYNKPGAVLDFMTKGKPLADYMLVIDSDMQLRHPFQPTKYNMTRGKAVSADYTYMVGCTNDLAPRHIPEVPVRNDTLAGPFGRYCDEVGGYTFMHRDDLSKVAPLWLSVTEDVRADPEAWRLSGDAYVKEGGKPWISEMYGYSFACAKSEVWHTWDKSVMHYPGAPARDVPKILHYGLLFEFGGYKFDKHWHYDFDVAKCAPWDLNDPSKRTGGVFQHPLSVSQLKKYREGFTKNAQGASPNDDLPQYFGDLLMMETIVTLNAGICHYHLRHCPPHQQMYDECQKALELYDDCKAEVRTVEQRMLECTDRMPARCPAWVAADQCTTNRDFMEDACRKACGLCKEGESTAERHPQPARDELENMLIQLSVELAGGVPAAGSGQAAAGGRIHQAGQGQAGAGKSGGAGSASSGSGGAGVRTHGGGGADGGDTTANAGVDALRRAADARRELLLSGARKEGPEGVAPRLDPAERKEAARRMGAGKAKDGAAPGTHGKVLGHHLEKIKESAMERVDVADVADAVEASDVMASLREEDDMLPRTQRARGNISATGGLVLWVLLLGLVLVAAPSLLMRARRRSKTVNRRE